MISLFNWFILTKSTQPLSFHGRLLLACFLIAATTVFINPFLYQAIAILCLAFFLVVWLSNNLEKQDSNWHKREISKTIVLISLIVMCLIVPQVETDLAKFSVSKIVQIKL